VPRMLARDVDYCRHYGNTSNGRKAERRAVKRGKRESALEPCIHPSLFSIDGESSQQCPTCLAHVPDAEL
jgi:hypothetical protein